jgi:uncharacterized RDD family membrane protein YckC
VTTERSRARALQGMRAGFVSRVVAAAIDVVIAFVALLAALGAWAVLVYLVTSDPLELPDPGAVWSGASFAVLLVVVLTVAWSGSGRTIGNASVGLRVLTESGNRPTWRRALVRAVIVVGLPVISMLWILVSRKNAGLHDLVARTAVVYDWRPRLDSQSRPPE